MSVRTKQRQPDPADFIRRASDQLGRGERLTLVSGEDSLELDHDLASAILKVVGGASAGQAVEVAVLPDEITTGQAADLLRVSRPTVVKLVDRGTIPSRRIGAHRRLLTTDVLAYREHMRRDRSAAVEDLTAQSQALGLYDR